MSKNHKTSNVESVNSTNAALQNSETASKRNMSKFPVSLEFFKKWTHYEEIVELSLRSASCGDEEKYQKLKQMPKFSENAIRNYYTLFYLKPKIREKYPIRLKPIPKHAKEKLLQIPNNIKSKHFSNALFGNNRKRLQEENSPIGGRGDCNNNVADNAKRNGMEMQTKGDLRASNDLEELNEQESNKLSAADNNVETNKQTANKSHIKILEDIFLPPINLNSTQIENRKCDCIFCHFPLSDFQKSTNVTDLIKQSIIESNENDDPDRICNEIRAFYIKCLLKNLSPDESANLSMSLQKYKLLSKYHEICKECKVRYKIEKADNTQIINTSFPEQNPVTTVNNTYDKRDEDDLRAYSSQDDDSDPTINGRMRFIDVLKYNLNERLSRNWSLTDYIPVDYITFKKTLSYEEPLEQIIKFIASSDEILSKRILQDNDLYDLILKEFYLNYFTNDEMCEKYPLTFKASHLSPAKSKIENSNNRSNQQQCMESLNPANGLYYSAVFSNEFLLSFIRRKCKDPIKQQIILNQIKISFPPLTRSRINSSNPTETESDSNLKNTDKANQLMPSKVKEKQSLGYVLLTSHGHKHQILKEILSLTFEEFRSLTAIHETSELKSDNVSMEVYRHIIVEKDTWPMNLFINLKKLITLLLSRGIEFAKDDTYNPLDDIPPIVLHWSDLVQSTNFVYCARRDYLKCTGKILDNNNTELLQNRCAAYYSRCWKHNRWIWQTPKIKKALMEEVNQEFLRNMLKSPWTDPVELSIATKTSTSPIISAPTIVTTSVGRTINSESLIAANTSIISTVTSPAAPISPCTTEIYINEKQTISGGNVLASSIIKINLSHDNNLKETAKQNNCRRSQVIGIDKQANVVLLPIRKKKKKVNSSTTRNTKGRADLVPQFSHKFRALPLQMQEISPNHLENDLTSTKLNNVMKTGGNDIQISQELSTNISIFNNINAITPSKLTSEKVLGNLHSTSSPTLIEESPESQVINTQANMNHAEGTGNLEVANETKSKKVIQNKCLTVTNIYKSKFSQTSKPQYSERPKTIKKIIFYRSLLYMDFFQALKVHHIINYQIPTITTGSTHIQALIKFDNIRIRLDNKSLLALFPTWSRSLKWHLFTVLKDIGEYHYAYNFGPTSEDVRDLRVRILHLLFQTAPKYSLSVISFQSSNPEFANCENVNCTIKMLSPSALRKAIPPRILANISNYKSRHAIRP